MLDITYPPAYVAESDEPPRLFRRPHCESRATHGGNQRAVAVIGTEMQSRISRSSYPEPFALLPGPGFNAGTGNGHCLINEPDEGVVYLEVGDRTPEDEGSYPDDDLKGAARGREGAICS